MNKKSLSITFLSVLFFINCVYAFGYNNPNLPKLTKEIVTEEGIISGANYSINVNNSDYWQGYTPTTYKSWLESVFNYITSWLTPSPSQNWIFNDTNYLYFNETKLNNTYVSNNTSPTFKNVTANIYITKKVGSSVYGTCTNSTGWTFVGNLDNGGICNL